MGLGGGRSCRLSFHNLFQLLLETKKNVALAENNASRITEIYESLIVQMGLGILMRRVHRSTGSVADSPYQALYITSSQLLS
jgi:hypothetical protein